MSNQTSRTLEKIILPRGPFIIYASSEAEAEEKAWDIQGEYQNDKAYIEAMVKAHLKFIEDL